MDLLKAGAAALGVSLDPLQMAQFRRYYQELVDWNRRVNLTSVTDCVEVQSRHFVDSLSVSAVLNGSLLDGGRALDVGSGAGFPGLPLKIAFPKLRITLMDATNKKASFLRHVSRVLGLDDVEVLAGRAETLAHDADLREEFDLVLSRAVAQLPVLAELTLPFCRLGGLVVAQKGVGVDAEVRQARKAIEAVGGTLKEVREVQLADFGAGAALVVIEKEAATPPKYPRRSGIPAKRPL